jgi:tRNA (guanine37-N1)-methyltransferase
MVMLFEPLERALMAIRTERAEARPVSLVHFTPTGERIDQRIVDDFAAGPGAVLLCGRYEGIDQRLTNGAVRSAKLILADYRVGAGRAWGGGVEWRGGRGGA